MKNLQVNKVLPVINANFEEVKASLIETMEKYKGIDVTEDGLKDCKATQKDLAKIRRDIDTYRKLIKKEMTAPIIEFENECKELIDLVKETETPILEGIAIYDEKRRQEKIDYISDNITIAVSEVGLNEKYAARLKVSDIKFTLNTSLKSIREDINEKAKNLKDLQIAEEEKIASDISIIETTVQASNEGQEVVLDINNYVDKYKKGMPLNSVIQAINNDRSLIEVTAKKTLERVGKEAKENDVAIPEEIKSPEVKVEESRDRKVNENEIKKCFYTLKITHDLDHMRELAKFLKENGFKFEKLDEGWV